MVEKNLKSDFKVVTPVDVIEKFARKLEANGVSFRKHHHGDDFSLLTFSTDSKDTKDCVTLFLRHDGLLELIHENSGFHRIYGNNASLRDYIQFQKDFGECLDKMTGNNNCSISIESEKVKLSARLYLQQFQTSLDFNLSPSQIYKAWQQSRGRDGVTKDGKIIPHLG